MFQHVIAPVHKECSTSQRIYATCRESWIQVNWTPLDWTETLIVPQASPSNIIAWLNQMRYSIAIFIATDKKKWSRICTLLCTLLQVSTIIITYTRELCRRYCKVNNSIPLNLILICSAILMSEQPNFQFFSHATVLTKKNNSYSLLYQPVSPNLLVTDSDWNKALSILP